MSKIAIIGTAGRDHNKPMTTGLWEWMLHDVSQRVGSGDHLVSGGAAWADHLAVIMFLSKKVKGLTLHLPAPISVFESPKFDGPPKSSGSAANFYHQKFSRVIGWDSIADIVLAASYDNCNGDYMPVSSGYAAMFARNRKVADVADLLIAYTFGGGDVPADGGTKNTWDLCKGHRIHVSLPYLP